MPRIALAIVVVAAVWCESANAGPLPPAFNLLQTQAQSATYGTSGVAGQTVMGQGSIFVQTTSNHGVQTSNAGASVVVNNSASGLPETMLTASASYSETHPVSGTNYPYAEATGELVYVVQINGPALGAVTLDFNLSAHTSGAYGATGALFGYYVKEISAADTITIGSNGVATVSGPAEPTVLADNGEFGQLASESLPIVQDGTSTDNQVLGGYGGTQFLIALSVDAAAFSNVGIYSNFPPPASVSATIDPTLAIDPRTPNASAFSLTYSPGIVPASVPEPASMILMLIGAAGLIGRSRWLTRKHRSARRFNEASLCE